MFEENKIEIVKYNSSLDSTVQNFPTIDGFIQVIDGELIITNKKPVELPKYILEADPNDVKDA